MTSESNGTDESDAKGEPEAKAEPLPPPPAEVGELAEACVAFVERATKMRLDYTPETLPILDHYVREARRDALTKPDVLELIAAPIGAYVGEVTRRLLPLSWFAPPSEFRRWRIELEDVFCSMNPIGAAVEALLLHEAEGWGATFRLRSEDEEFVSAVVANLPEVSEDEYYAPSSRVEMLTIIADALVGRGAAEDQPTLKFTSADYAGVRAEAIGDELERDRREPS